jgi:IclR family transcriptional regulator, acetate operon repressor
LAPGPRPSRSAPPGAEAPPRAEAADGPAPDAAERNSVFFRAFAMLEFVAKRGGPVSPIEIAEALGLPKPTAYRMIEGFERQGLLSRPFGAKRVAVGPRLTDFAFDVMHASVQYAPRRIILENLVRDIGETCNIGTLDASEIVYLDRVEAKHWPLRLQFGIGSRVPLHCTAIGKLFLAWLPEPRRRALLARLDLAPLTPATLTTLPDLEAEFARIREEGLSIDREEYLAGVVCCAAPVFARGGELRAGVAIQAPAARLSAEGILRHRDRLLAAAADLAGSFGFE